MTTQRFQAEIEDAGGGGAYVVLPAEVVTGLGGGARFRVTGVLNGVDFASSTMGMGDGRVCLGVHKATRQAAGVSIGDLVDVSVARDDRPREVTIPTELAAALAEDPDAAAAFERLSFSHRREYAEWVGEAKRADTRTRRVREVLERLRD